MVELNTNCFLILILLIEFVYRDHNLAVLFFLISKIVFSFCLNELKLYLLFVELY